MWAKKQQNTHFLPDCGGLSVNAVNSRREVFKYGWTNLAVVSFDKVIGISTSYSLRVQHFSQKGAGISSATCFDCIFLCTGFLKRMLNVSVRSEYPNMYKNNKDCSLYLSSSFCLRSSDIISLPLKSYLGVVWVESTYLHFIPSRTWWKNGPKSCKHLGHLVISSFNMLNFTLKSYKSRE